MRTRDENKENLVREKALEMLVKEGFDGFSMQKLAKVAGVSPATLYIYYRHKDDLITQLGIEEAKKMTSATFQNFDPKMPFSEGLSIQWHNRAKYWIENPIATQFFEQINHSPYRDKVMVSVNNDFAEVMKEFVGNAIKNEEVAPMPVEVYWSIAYAPLYTLIRFHQEGRSIGNREFTFRQDYMEQTLALVLKALKP